MIAILNVVLAVGAIVTLLIGTVYYWYDDHEKTQTYFIIAILAILGLMLK